MFFLTLNMTFFIIFFSKCNRLHIFKMMMSSHQIDGLLLYSLYCFILYLRLICTSACHAFKTIRWGLYCFFFILLPREDGISVFFFFFFSKVNTKSNGLIMLPYEFFRYIAKTCFFFDFPICFSSLGVFFYVLVKKKQFFLLFLDKKKSKRNLVLIPRMYI